MISKIRRCELGFLRSTVIEWVCVPNDVYTAMLPLPVEHPGTCFAHLFHTQQLYGFRVISHTYRAHFSGGKVTLFLSFFLRINACIQQATYFRRLSRSLLVFSACTLHENSVDVYEYYIQQDECTGSRFIC